MTWKSACKNRKRWAEKWEDDMKDWTGLNAVQTE